MRDVWQKFAVLGITAVVAGMAFMQGPQAVDNSIESLKAPTSITAQVDYETVLKERMEAALEYSQKVGNRYEGQGVEIAYEIRYATDSLKAGGGADFGAVDNFCLVTMDLNKNTNSIDGLTESQFKNDMSAVTDYSASEKVLLNEFMIEHEAAHCGFVYIDAPFQVKGNPELSAALNKTFADTSLRGSFETELTDSFDGKVTHHGLADALNESYADAVAAIMMLKEHNNSPEIQKFLGKVSAERAITTAISSRVGDDLVNAYDMDGAIKNVLKDDVLQKIANTNDAQELNSIALDIANANLLNSLAKKTDTQLDTALGAWTVEKSANVNVWGTINTRKDGSLGTEAVKEAFNAMGEKAVTDFMQAKDALSWTGGKTQEEIDSAVRTVEDFSKNVSAKISIDGNQVKETVSLLKYELNQMRQNGFGKTKDLNQVLESEAPVLGLSTKSLKEAKATFGQLKEAQPEAPTFAKIKF